MADMTIKKGDEETSAQSKASETGQQTAAMQPAGERVVGRSAFRTPATSSASMKSARGAATTHGTIQRRRADSNLLPASMQIARHL